MDSTTSRLLVLRPFLRPYRWRLAALGVALLGVALLEGLGVGLLFPLVEYVQLGESFQAQGRTGRLVFAALGRAGLVPSVPLFISVIFCVVMTLLLLKFLVTRASASIYNPLGEDLREEAFRRIIKAHLFYFYDQSSGTLINVLDSEIEYVAVSFHFAILLLTAAISILLYTGFILFISWRLTLLMAALALLRYAVAGMFFRKIRALSAEQASLRTALKAYLVGIHQGIELIKSYATVGLEINRFHALGERLRASTDRQVRNTARSQFCDGLLGEGLLCFLIYGAISWLHMPGAVLLTFLVIATRLIPKVTGVNEARVRITEHMPRITVLPEILSQRSPPALPWGHLSKPAFESAVRFENVSFSYPGGRLPSLNGINLEIKKGESVAVVGESGSGKSTLARLLLRLFDPSEGRITVDGIPLPDLREQDWTRLVSIVSQDTFIFDDTVEKNVKYGSEKADAERFRRALRHARAEEFIGALPEREKTRLGERGIKLSGGQRQRIAIARAFLRDSQILILDEATSAMDAVTERQIHDAIVELARDRTMLIIAHRFTTVRQADRIIVLDKGRIVESGTHDELSERDGRYRKFLELQKG